MYWPEKTVLLEHPAKEAEFQEKAVQKFLPIEYSVKDAKDEEKEG